MHKDMYSLASGRAFIATERRFKKYMDVFFNKGMIG